MAAEVALQDAAVLGPVEKGAPPFELVDAVRGLERVQLGHALVVEHLAAAHGVAEVNLPVVLRPHVAHGRSGTALGHDGVRLAEERLADERCAKPALFRLDGGSKSCSARPDDDDVEVVGLVSRQSLEQASRNRSQNSFGSENTPEATSLT